MPDTPPTTRWFHYAAFSVVSVYLVLVGGVLMICGRIPLPVSPRRVVGVILRGGRIRGPLGAIEHLRGNCYVAEIDADLRSDDPATIGPDGHEPRSHLKLYEDDRLLLLAHRSIDEIAEQGRGRFLHTARHIYFSTSDNSDPRANGRRYHFKD